MHTRTVVVVAVVVVVVVAVTVVDVLVVVDAVVDVAVDGWGVEVVVAKGAASEKGTKEYVREKERGCTDKLLQLEQSF